MGQTCNPRKVKSSQRDDMMVPMQSGKHTLHLAWNTECLRHRAYAANPRQSCTTTCTAPCAEHTHLGDPARCIASKT